MCIRDRYYLGHVSEQAANQLPYVAKLHSKDPRRSYAAASYTEGSVGGCALVDGGGPGLKRGTEVRMTCAADGQDRIVSVQEVQVCRYRLMFASSKLCKLDEFARPDEKAQEIVCWYADDEEAAEVEAAAARLAAAAALAAEAGPTAYQRYWPDRCPAGAASRWRVRSVARRRRSSCPRRCTRRCPCDAEATRTSNL